MRLRTRRAPAEPGQEHPRLGEGYEPIAQLSRGNDFEVWDAWSIERGSRVIIKTLREDMLDDARKRERLMREGTLLCDLTHPHIVRGYEVRDEPWPMVVMETLGGQTLSHMINADGVLSDAEAAIVGLQVGAAVRYLHATGYLHLDLKPSNVIAEAGRARLIDLGLSEPHGPIRAGVGTWCYLAPEQARGEECGPAADVWGIGAILFEALTGWPPFDEPGRETNGVLDEHLEYPQLHRRARPLAEASGAGAGLAALVDSCLDPGPGTRPSLTRLLGELEPLAEVPAAERRWAISG